MEGYGASFILQEMLTVKSDDIRGRLKTYERIVKGQNLSEPGVPESFRVLVKELQGLGLDVEIMYDDGFVGGLVLEDDEYDRSRIGSLASFRSDVAVHEDEDPSGGETPSATESFLFGGGGGGDDDEAEEETQR